MAGPRSATSSRPLTPEAVSKTILLRAFDSGNGTSFFRHWKSIVVDWRDDAVQQLDFYLRVYFATRSSNENSKKTGVTKAMAELKKYLESKAGRRLANVPEFMPYFALPFISNVGKHPLFKHLQEKEWTEFIRKELTTFFESKATISSNNRLTDSTFNEAEHAGEIDTYNQMETERDFYKSLCYKTQMEYRRLIIIATELIDALESAVHGHPVSLETMQRLRLEMLGTSTSVTDNGVQSKREDTIAEEENWQLPSLDWSRIHAELDQAAGHETSTMLQSLRLLLTQSRSERVRNEIAELFFANNILRLSISDKDVCDFNKLLNNADRLIQERWCRLLNTVCSLKSGRTYALKDANLLPSLVTGMQSNHILGLGLYHVVAALQKLSLRRTVQLRLIKRNVVEWLIDFLQSHRTLPDYAVEYSMALLMTLSLTTSGKRAAANNPEAMLELLRDLLNHANAAIHSYVNGALFSILTLAHVRHKAKKMGMHGVLDKALAEATTPDDLKQIPYILQQLNGELADRQPTPSDDETTSSIDDEDEAVLSAFASRTTPFQSTETLEAELDDGDQQQPGQQQTFVVERLLLRHDASSSSPDRSQTPVDRSSPPPPPARRDAAPIVVDKRLATAATAAATRQRRATVAGVQSRSSATTIAGTTTSTTTTTTTTTTATKALSSATFVIRSNNGDRRPLLTRRTESLPQTDEDTTQRKSAGAAPRVRRVWRSSPTRANRKNAVGK